MGENGKDKLVFDRRETYLAALDNVEGTRMFNNCYFRNLRGELIDVCENGKYPCAFAVSSILKRFDYIKNARVTIQGLQKELNNCGWNEVLFKYKVDEDILVKILEGIEGAVILWHPWLEMGLIHKHVGFYLGNEVCVSTHSFGDTMVKHNLFYKNPDFIPHRVVGGFYFNGELFKRERLAVAS